MPPKKKVRKEALWEFLDDDGSWVGFEAEDSALIETNFNKGYGEFHTSALSFNKGYTTKYVFNFDELKQVNEDSKKERKIRRHAPAGEFQWEWKDDLGVYVAFYDNDIAAIEKLWVDNGLNKPVKTKALEFNKGFNSPYTFTFTALKDTSIVEGTQKNEDSGTVRAIRRASKKLVWDTKSYGMAATPAPAAAPAPAGKAGAVSTVTGAKLPAHWTAGGQLVPVAAGTEEFKTVQNKFLAGLPGKTVLAIHRVQNEALWSFYALMADTISKLNDGKPNEQTLFYGERVKANFDMVCKLGFDTRVADSGNLGKGLYFGTSSKFTDSGRCLQNKDGSKEVLVCRCAVGTAAVGSKDIRRPPPRVASKPTGQLFDCCTDNTSSPDVYVFFANSQMYPEYTLQYK